MQDLVAQAYELSELLMGALDECRNAGVQNAENEAEYRKMLRKEILLERDNKTPVTIISDICRGKEEIADAKLNRDCSEVIYKAAQEAVNVYKLRLRIINDQIQREWHSGNREDW